VAAATALAVNGALSHYHCRGDDDDDDDGDDDDDDGDDS
jgi:hypothetical protein